MSNIKTIHTGGGPVIRRRGNTKKRKIAAQCYLLLLIPIIGYIAFTVYPVLWTFRWSLFSFKNVTGAGARFVGLDNFVTMFTKDFTYWKVWGNTLLFTVMKIPLEIALAMVLAVILTNMKRGSGFFRSAYYLPSVVSVAVIGLIFSNMFSHFGIINGMLQKTGLISENINWFSSKWTSMATLVTASIWNTFGINVMYLMAAMTNVPKEVYESAEIDGATGIKAFFKITLPMIAPVFQTILLLSLVGTLSVNDLILVLSNGAPSGQTFTVMSYLTRTFVPGFVSSQSSPPLGYGCAMSVLTTILFAVISIIYNRASKKLNDIM